jgi:hypothetical protein
MIDVQSLIFIAAIERDFWAVDRPHDVTVSPPADQRDPGKDDTAEAKPYLCVCAIYRNEASYLREWIEFHRLVGVERFYLYDNLSTDAHQEALAPYLEDGFVTLHEWKVVPPPDQRDTYDHCLSEHGHDSRWMAFIDIDEFLFSPTGRPLPEVLVDYERWPGVGVNWAMFGTSGHRTKPPGLVLENYLMRADAPSNRLIKSIVDPTRVVRCGGAHHFIYRSLLAIDENQYPIDGPMTKSVSFSRLRVNHYVTKSGAETRGKVGRGSRFGWDSLEPWRSSQRERRFHQELDRAITIYVPDLREALARTAARKPDPFGGQAT